MHLALAKGGDASAREEAAMTTRSGWPERGGRHGAIGASLAGSRRAALRVLLSGVAGLALTGAVPEIAEAALEANWRLCTKCRGIVGSAAGRPCPAGGEQFSPVHS